MSWPAAFVLGAIVSPTDPVAATAIAGRLGVPRRVVTIVEGEALINDATALVAYKVAVAAVLTGTLQRLGGGRPVRLLRHRRRRDRPRHRLGDRAGARAPRRPAGRDHDRARERLRGLPAGRGARPLRRHRGGRDRPLHGLADLAPDQLDRAHAGRRGVADPRLPAQLVPVRLHRPAAADDPRRPARRGLRHGGADPLRRRRDRDGDRGPAGVDLRLRLPPALAVPQPARAQPGPEAAQRRDHRVDGDARRRLARRRARAARRHGLGRALRRAPADPVRRLLRDPRDARAAGALAAVADPAAERRERRRRRDRAGGARPPARRRGGARAHRRSRARGLDARETRSTACAGSTATAASASPPASTTTSTTSRSRSAAAPGAG